MFEKRGKIFLQKVLLSVTFLVSKLLKLFKVSYKIYVVYCSFFLSVRDFDFKYLVLNLDLFIISLCKFFVIKGASFTRICFFLIGACLLKTGRISSLKLPCWSLLRCRLVALFFRDLALKMAGVTCLPMRV